MRILWELNNMLEHKNNVALIQEVNGDNTSTERERALADRLFGAIEELDRLTAALTRLEIAHGGDT
jgi:hypothetical protein